LAGEGLSATMQVMRFSSRLALLLLASTVTVSSATCRATTQAPLEPATPPATPAVTAPAATPAVAQPPAPAPLTAATTLRSADLLADVDALEKIYRALHPGLYRYNSEAELTALFAEARRELGRDRSLGEAFLVLTRLTAGIRCGHSYPSFFNQNEAIRDALFQGPRLPFWFRWLGDDMVIVKSFADRAELVPGTVVEAIGGTPAVDLLDAMLPLARADGQNVAKRRAYLEVVGDAEIEAFDVFLPLLFPALLPAQGDIELTVRPPRAQARTLTVPLQSAAARAGAARAQRAGAGADAPLWTLKTLTRGRQSVAYLEMPDWVAYKTRWDWKGFLHATMAQLVAQKTPALVIDLRGNEGGNDVGDEILAHMLDAPIARRTTVRRVRFEAVPDDLRPMLDTWDDSFFTLGQGATAISGDWRELPRDTAGDVIAPQAPRYRGKVVVLVDAANSSATFQFAMLVQKRGLATLVGTGTGGSQRGINGGAFFFARLPRTGLEVDVPLIGTFPPGPIEAAATIPDAGVTPDVLVPLTAEDIAAGRDRQLEVALDVALGKRR
jgi:hypothetical protein